MRLQRLLGGLQDLERLRELGVQLPEHVGRRFEAAPFIVEPGDLGRERRPVELAEIGQFGELRQGVEPLADASLLGLHRADAAAEVAEPHLEPARVGFEGGDLGRVGPAEHVAAAVVDAVAVVLLVALARRLDLAGPGDGAGLAPELLGRRAARHVETAGQLVLQPVVERRVRLHRELPYQGVAMKLRQLAPPRPAHPEVDEPAPEVLRIHPPGHPRVALVGDEQRESEAAQQPFRRALPVALLLAHLEQLARERHVRLVQVERAAERGAHGDLLRRDVAAACLEALDLAGEGIVLLLPLPQVHAQLGQVVLKTGLVRSKLLGLVREACPLVEKGRVVRRGGLVHPAGELRVALGLACARFAFAFEPLNLSGQAFEAVAAVLGDGALQLLHVAALAVPALRGALDLRALARPVVGEPRDACIQQVALQPREERPEGLPALAELLDLGDQPGMAIAVGHERGEVLDLAPCPEHRLVGAAQVVEVLDESLDPGRHVERLQHVAAHELGEIAHRFHGHGLVEEIERLLVVDPEAAAEPRAVRREGVPDLDPGAAQPLAQAGDVGAEVGELAGDGQIALGGGKEPRGLALRIRDPEHLGQGHGLVVALVPEYAEDDRVVAGVAQRDGAGGDAQLVAFGLVVAQHVGAQGPLPASRPRPRGCRRRGAPAPAGW